MNNFSVSIMKRVVACTLIGFLLSGFVPIEKPKKTVFEQERFVISFWFDPPADEKMDIRYKEISEAHFNLVKY